MKNSKPTPSQIKDIIKSRQAKGNGAKLPEKVSDSESDGEKRSDSYESLSGAEDFEDYKVDGYHPTLLGESFSNGRYVAIQKLGWGHFSTVINQYISYSCEVWLVLDKKKEEHFALKIQKSKKSYSEAAQDELDLLRDLRNHETDEVWAQFVREFDSSLDESKWIKNWTLKKPMQVEELIQKRDQKEKQQAEKQQQQQASSQFQEDDDFEDISDDEDGDGEGQAEEDPSILIPSFDEESIKYRITQEDTYSIRLIDNFVHFGIHGKHFCSVFEIMGPNLLDLIQHFDNYDKKMALWLVKVIAKQLLVGLVYMHDVCKIIHTDLKPENIMIDLEASQKKEFIEDLKNLKKKPMSMKFLHQLKQSTSGKNKKKYLKKKNKKKQTVEEESKTSELTQPQTPQEEINIEKQITTSQTTQEETKQPIENNQQQNNAEKIEKKKKGEQQQKKGEQQQKKGKARNQDKQEEAQMVEEQPKEKKVENTIEGERMEEQKKKDSDNASDSGYETDKTPSVDEETLYTLKWKEHIKIKLTKNIRVKIVDFGNACWTHKHFTDNIQTREYRSPEAILGMDYQANTDIWSLACIIFELLTNNYLFKPKKGEGFGKSDDHLALMMETLGKMNSKFALSGNKSRKYFNKSGNLINIKHLHSMPICDVLIEDYDFEMNEAYLIQDFLLPMLEYDPKKRVSARDALKHPWLWCY